MSTRSTDEKQAILRERSRQLATPEQNEPEGRKLYEMVTLSIAQLQLGISIEYISEVIIPARLTPLFGAPEFYLGVIHHRGAILPTVDMRRFFGQASDGLVDLSLLVVVQQGNRALGIWVESVSEVNVVYESHLQVPAPRIKGIDAAYIQAVTKSLEIILDMDAMMHDGRLYLKRTRSSERS